MHRFKIIGLKSIIFGFVTLFILTSYFLYSKYFSRTKSQDLVLSEDQEEFKKRPIDRGGIVIPNSGSLIYEKLNHGDSKNKEAEANLQPETEEPIVLDFKNSLENVENYDSIDDILANLDLSQEDEKEQISTKNPANELNQSINNNEEVQAVTLNDSNEESINSTEMADNVMPNIVETKIESKTNTEALVSPADQSLTNQKSVNNTKLKIIQIDDQSNKLHNLNLRSNKDSGYKIHLSSAWSEKEAKNEWQKIKARHAKYLDKTELIIKKVTASNGKIIYLVMAGNYPSLDKAKLVCKKLQLSNQNCIVTK